MVFICPWKASARGLRASSEAWSSAAVGSWSWGVSACPCSSHRIRSPPGWRCLRTRWCLRRPPKVFPRRGKKDRGAFCEAQRNPSTSGQVATALWASCCLQGTWPNPLASCTSSQNLSRGLGEHGSQRRCFIWELVHAFWRLDQGKKWWVWEDWT